MNEIFGKTATSDSRGRPSAMQLSSFFTNLRCLSGDKRCRVWFYCGSLQSALQFCAWLNLKWCQTGYLQGGSRFLAQPGAKTADGSALLTGSDFEAWRDWRRILLRSPSELHEVIAREGRVARHTDPELIRKPQSYDRLVRDMSLRGLVSFGSAF